MLYKLQAILHLLHSLGRGNYRMNGLREKNARPTKLYLEKLLAAVVRGEGYRALIELAFVTCERDQSH